MRKRQKNMKRNSLILLLGLIVAACGGADSGMGTDTGGTTTTSLLDSPDEAYPLLTVSDEGGFIPVDFNLRRIPRVVLMNDGTIYVPGPTTMEYPGPAVQPVQRGIIDDPTSAAIEKLIDDTGLAAVDDENNNAAADRVADATTTVFEMRDADGTRHRFSVYALGMTDIDYDDARVAALEALATAVDDAVAAMSDAEIWQPESVVVYVSDQLTGYDQEFANTMEYPLGRSFDRLDGGDDRTPAQYRCTTLEGSEAATLLDTMSEANAATTFVDPDGHEYSVVIKPLLPGQDGC